jgi:hypothetical protein
MLVMSSFFLDLNDRLRVIDFIEEALPYLPADNLVRVRAAGVVREIADGEKVSKEALADLAKTVGRATYVPRVAVRRYVSNGGGAGEEWRRVVAGVSRSTGHLLERFRGGTGAVSLKDVLAHEASGSALRELERLEIEAVRAQILPAMWIEDQKKIGEIAKEVERELEACEAHLKTLRSIAFDEPNAPQDEIVLKIEQFEDRLYFAGEEIPPEKIAQEVKGYREEGIGLI